MAMDISEGLRKKLSDPELEGFLQVQILIRTPRGLHEELVVAEPCSETENNEIIKRHYSQAMAPMVDYLSQHGILHDALPLEGEILAQLTGEELEGFIEQGYKGFVIEYKRPKGED